MSFKVFAKFAGEGAAYGTKRREHVLNVPASKMSSLPDDPDHLLKVQRPTASIAAVEVWDIGRRRRGGGHVSTYPLFNLYG